MSQKPNAEFDVIIYGASGFTGRLVAEYMAAEYGTDVKWAMAGRNGEKLAQVRDLIGAPSDTPLIIADATDEKALAEMCARAKAIATTTGPYQLYGEPLLGACIAAGTDYVDLCGEPNWMAAMIDKYGAAAKKSGARIVFSCGFDSIPFDLGVYYLQQKAKEKLGHALPNGKGPGARNERDFFRRHGGEPESHYGSNFTRSRAGRASAQPVCFV